MNDKKLAAVILAAGKGTRMQSQQAKVLHPIAGRPMASYPARIAQAMGCVPNVLVVGHQAADVEQALAQENLTFVLQQEQLGTGHALLCALPGLKDFSGDLLLLCGDVPLMRRRPWSAC
jgi:bifunctional UDP-N-acetylglucosamine pyrophosphorylase / glucosamine-1-phosphate N-acetyltransferase